MATYACGSALHNRLGYKIGVGFSLVAIILIGTILYTLVQIHAVIQKTEALSDHLNSVVENSIGLRNKLNNMIGAERDWLITGQTAYQLQRKQLWINDVLPASNALLLSTDNTAEKNVSKDVGRMNNAIQEINSLALANESMTDMASARVFFFQRTAPLFLKLRTQLSAFIDQQRHISNERLLMLREQMMQTYFINLGLLLIGAILCVLMGFLLTRTMTRPLSQLVKMADELAKGNLDQHVAISGALEFDILSQAFNRVIQTLQEVETVTGSMAEGDYSHRIDIKSDKDRLGIAVNAMLDDFNQIVDEANAIAQGDFHSDIKPRSPIDTLGQALSNMTLTLRHNHEEAKQQNWLKDGLTEFAAMVSEARDLKHLCQSGMNTIAHYSQAGTGAIYLFDAHGLQINNIVTCKTFPKNVTDILNYCKL